MKSTPIEELGAIGNIEPLHLTFKAEIAKSWSRIRKTAKRRYSDWKMVPLKAMIRYTISETTLRLIYENKHRKSITK